MNELTRQALVNATLAGAVVSGLWFAGTRDARARLILEQDTLESELESIEQGLLLMSPDMPDPHALLSMLLSDADVLSGWCGADVSPGTLYDRVLGLADDVGVKLTRVNPGQTNTFEFGDQQAWGGQIEARSFRIEAYGAYQAIADFIDLMTWSTGVTRIDSFRVFLGDTPGELRLNMVVRSFDTVAAAEALSTAGFGGPGGASDPAEGGGS